LIFFPLCRVRHNGKKINGRKRFIVTDTLGLLIVVVVLAASVQDLTVPGPPCSRRTWRNARSR
jgi:hypothetical protein